MHQKRNSLVIKASAKQDLENIYLYSLKEFGLKKSEKYIMDIDLAIQKLRENSKLGQTYHHRHGYRFYKAASHIIFYKSLLNKIIIVRILHKLMDYEKHL
jgi:toxin ParE1/3/4